MRKKTSEMTPVDFMFMEVEEKIDGLIEQLKEIQTITTVLSSKINVSYCLLVVRKVEESKLDDLKKLID